MQQAENTNITVQSEQEETKKHKKETSLLTTLARMFQRKTTIVGAVILGILVFGAVFAPVLTPYSPYEMDILNSYQAPSMHHLCGTDDLGRDILTRLMYGARYSLSFGILSTIISLGVGLIVGATAGYFGGKVDNIIMRILDVIQAFPHMLLCILVSTVLGTGFINTCIALGVGGIAGTARLLRASMLNVRGMEYVEAASSINCSNVRIIAKHVVPNSMSPVIVSTCMGMARSVIAASSLSFIGLGVQPPSPEWGAMLSSGRSFIRDYPHLVIAPGICIMLTVLSVNLIGDSLRDALDPKLKK